jgi:hypothetical protein
MPEGITSSIVRNVEVPPGHPVSWYCCIIFRMDPIRRRPVRHCSGVQHPWLILDVERQTKYRYTQSAGDVDEQIYYRHQCRSRPSSAFYLRVYQPEGTGWWSHRKD